MPRLKTSQIMLRSGPSTHQAKVTANIDVQQTPATAAEDDTVRCSTPCGTWTSTHVDKHFNLFRELRGIRLFCVPESPINNIR